jgi:hypothetical protein
MASASSHTVSLRGDATAPPLQIAECPRAQPGRLGQLLLRQPRHCAQLPEHASELDRPFGHSFSYLASGLLLRA